ncbi:MAG TPA: choice-of-anchor M domain-containing protein [Solirubrobacteraceae bacterium]|nr:choice-of-anchor M domain-containing protein [Solirubrobacteraceae bacterium]
MRLTPPVSSRSSRSRAAFTGGALVVALLGAPAAADARVTLSSGHVDAIAARVTGGKLRLLVKDATGRSVRWHDPNDVTLRVVSRARTRLPRNGTLRFLGRPGATVWMIPQTQRSGIIWAGWNTEEVSRRQLRNLSWRLNRVSGPGRVAIFQTGSFGKPSVLFDSSRLPASRSLPLGIHAHGNWGFTARGTYRMSFTLRGTARSGKRLSATRALTFRVG